MPSILKGFGVRMSRTHDDPALDDQEVLTLREAAEMLLNECRMVLPGLQALFGFQLIAIFNSGFRELLTSVEQRLHLLAIALVVVAAAVIMTPAAIHRVNARRVSGRFVYVSTALLLWGMLPLAIGMCLDVYLIARIILGQRPLAAAIAGVLFVVCTGFWYLLPRASWIGDTSRTLHKD
jgi:hypothetical protein